MGLATELNYQANKANPVQKLVQAVASSRLGAWTMSKCLHVLDKGSWTVARGHGSATGLLTGLPVIMVTTTGARSGEQRTMPLIGVPVGDDLGLVAGNWGGQTAPAWSHNLDANPAATVSWKGVTVDVVARRAEGVDADQIMERAEAIYPGYAQYKRRADHREIKVYMLELAG
jgi:deazaflavin-dependent oxidoreductase (nitroreductase family)